MIAIDEERLRPFAVDAFVLRKDLEPSIGHHLQLRKKSLVGHIASDDDAVHLMLAEVFEGMDERSVCIGSTQMNITHDADDEIGLHQIRNLVSQRWQTKVSCSGKDGSALKEFSTIHGQLIFADKGTKKLAIIRHEVYNKLAYHA